MRWTVPLWDLQASRQRQRDDGTAGLAQPGPEVTALNCRWIAPKNAREQAGIDAHSPLD